MQTISEKILSRRDKLVKVIASAYGLILSSEEDNMQANSLLEAEAYYLESLIEKTRNTKNDLSDTTEMSQQGLFLEAISRGLTFSPSMNFVYIAYRNQEISIMENGARRIKTEKRLTYFPTAAGKQFLCIRAGSIERVRHVQIVRENDVFTHQQVNGTDQVNYVDNSHGTGRIIGGFVWVVLPGGKEDFFKMYRADMDRLAGFSARNSGGKENALYNSGPDGDYDSGFFKNKIISHALNPYNKQIKPSAFESDGDPDAFIPDLIQQEASPVVVTPQVTSLTEQVEQQAPAAQNQNVSLW